MNRPRRCTCPRCLAAVLDLPISYWPTDLPISYRPTEPAK